MKKKPKGRAWKRIQYNKRFLNLVVGAGGKPRSPNWNAGRPEEPKRA